MSDRTKNLICSIGFIILGIFLYIQASEIKVIMTKDLGSGFFPKVVAVAMIATAILELVLTLFKGQKDVKKETTEAENNEDKDKKGFILTIIAMVVYAAIFNELGFILSTILYLFAQITILSTDKNRKLPLFAVISVVTAVAVYGIFVHLIGMPLPSGLLYF
jgi:putative tricarboxylic transport membrane protein